MDYVHWTLRHHICTIYYISCSFIVFTGDKAALLCNNIMGNYNKFLDTHKNLIIMPAVNYRRHKKCEPLDVCVYRYFEITITFSDIAKRLNKKTSFNIGFVQKTSIS